MASISQPEVAISPTLSHRPIAETSDPFSKWSILCVSVVLSVTTILVGLRSYVRLWIKHERTTEDCMSNLILDGVLADLLMQACAFCPG